MRKLQVIDTKDLSRDEWLDQRRKGIGGSDIGAILGLNKWKSPVQVYLEKVGAYHDNVDNEAVEWGNIMEDVIAKQFAKKTGYKVRRCNALLQHDQHKWALANVDRLISHPERQGTGVLEIKTASEYVKGDWEDDEIPASYLLQLQWYLYVTGYQWGAFAVLIGGNKYRHKFIDRDDELIDMMIDQAKDFWFNNVLSEKPPLMDGSQASGDLLSALYPESNGSSITWAAERDKLIESYLQSKEYEKQAAEMTKLYENQLKDLLGDYEQAETLDHKVTWKSVTSRRVDTKALKQDHPDIYEQYAKESKSRRFSVK